MPGHGGFPIRWKTGKEPLPSKIAWRLCFASLLFAVLLLFWRDFFAPTSPRPGYECVSRGKYSESFVPCWFNPAVDAAGLVFVAAFILIPIIYGAYPHLHAPEDSEE